MKTWRHRRIHSVYDFMIRWLFTVEITSTWRLWLPLDLLWPLARDALQKPCLLKPDRSHVNVRVFEFRATWSFWPVGDHGNRTCHHAVMRHNDRTASPWVLQEPCRPVGLHCHEVNKCLPAPGILHLTHEWWEHAKSKYLSDCCPAYQSIIFLILQSFIISIFVLSDVFLWSRRCSWLAILALPIN